MICNKFDLLSQELADIRDSGLKSFRDIQVDETNILAWQGLILPVRILKINIVKYMIFKYLFVCNYTSVYIVITFL